MWAPRALGLARAVSMTAACCRARTVAASAAIHASVPRLNDSPTLVDMARPSIVQLERAPAHASASSTETSAADPSQDASRVEPPADADERAPADAPSSSAGTSAGDPSQDASSVVPSHDADEGLRRTPASDGSDAAPTRPPSELNDAHGEGRSADVDPASQPSAARADGAPPSDRPAKDRRRHGQRHRDEAGAASSERRQDQERREDGGRGDNRGASGGPADLAPNRRDRKKQQQANSNDGGGGDRRRSPDSHGQSSADGRGNRGGGSRDRHGDRKPTFRDLAVAVEARDKEGVLAMLDDLLPQIETAGIMLANQVVSLFAQVGDVQTADVKTAERVVAHMPKPTIYTFSMLMFAYARRKDVDKFLAYLERIHERIFFQRHERLDGLAFGRIVNAIAAWDGLSPEDEQKFVASLSRFQLWTLGPDATVAILGQCRSIKDLATGERFVKLLDDLGLVIDPTVHSSLLLMAKYDNNLPAARKYFDLLALGGRADTSAYFAFMSVLFNNKRYSEVLELERDMRVQGVAPSPFTICTSIRAAGFDRELDRVSELLDQYLSAPPSEIVEFRHEDDLNWNAAIEAAARCGDFRRVRLWLTEMIQAGVSPTLSTGYHLLVQEPVRLHRKYGGLAAQLLTFFNNRQQHKGAGQALKRPLKESELAELQRLVDLIAA